MVDARIQAVVSSPCPSLNIPMMAVPEKCDLGNKKAGEVVQGRVGCVRLVVCFESTPEFFCFENILSWAPPLLYIQLPNRPGSFLRPLPLLGPSAW